MSEHCNRQKMDCDANFSQVQEHQDMLEWLHDEHPDVYDEWDFRQEGTRFLFPGMNAAMAYAPHNRGRE